MTTAAIASQLCTGAQKVNGARYGFLHSSQERMTRQAKPVTETPSYKAEPNRFIDDPSITFV